MSSALAIASVTAVLKNLLDNRLVEHGIAASLGDVTVTALPPDRVPIGAEERSQLNLFLYRVTPNLGWRSAGAGRSNGRTGSAEAPPAPLPLPPLALDLHYLLTAYGEQDFHAEILLGHAMQLLHQSSTLTREAIRGALASPNGAGAALPPARVALAASPLAEQVQEIRITPESTNTEAMSSLWSALQARYRPTAAYKISAVLIEAEQ